MSDQPRILLVDDEPEIVDYLKIVLEGQGFECCGVNSPIDGIAKAKSETFAAIISDMKMPKMSGIEMITEIKTSPKNAGTPVVVLSGALTDDMMTRLEKLGIIDVMSKPPDMDILVKIIQKAAKNKTKNTGKDYDPKITKIFGDAFVTTMKSHLGDQIKLSPPVINDKPLSNIEYCGMISLVGRRLSGVLTISYQHGFTSEFAKVMLGGIVDGKQLEIFETSAGEITEQIAHEAIPYLHHSMGLYVEAMAPIVVHGRHAAIPIPGSQPRVKATGELNGKSCFMEFAFMDLAETFAGKVDSPDTKIIKA